MKTYHQLRLILALISLGISSTVFAQQTILKTNPVALVLGVAHGELEQAISERKSMTFYIQAGASPGRTDHSFFAIGTALRQYFSNGKTTVAPDAPFIQGGVHYAEAKAGDEETLATASMVGGSLLGGRQWLLLNDRISFGIGIGMEMNLTVTKTVTDLAWRDVNHDVFRVTGLINLGVVLN